MKTISESPEQLQTIAGALAFGLQPRERATVVTLSGDLGAGKTTFAQGVATALGIVETVSSPTYVIEKVYELSDQQFSHLIHIDAYRLKDERELDVLGWSEIILNVGNLILIEWPEKVSGLIPEDAIRIRFDIDGDARIISIDYGGKSSKEGDKAGPAREAEGGS